VKTNVTKWLDSYLQMSGALNGKLNNNGPCKELQGNCQKKKRNLRLKARFLIYKKKNVYFLGRIAKQFNQIGKIIFFVMFQNCNKSL